MHKQGVKRLLVENEISSIHRAFLGKPRCGKSRLVKAVAQRGRGTGTRGESHYEAVAFEEMTPQTATTAAHICAPLLLS